MKKFILMLVLGWAIGFTGVTIFTTRKFEVKLVYSESVEQNHYIVYGQQLPEPENLISETHIIDNWYTSDTFLETDVYDFTQKVTGDLVLYAKTSPRNPQIFYTVTFMLDETEVLDTVEVLAGESLSPSYKLEEEGYNFIGWDKVLINIQSHIVTYPVFTIKEFQVNFRDYNDVLLESHIVSYGNDVTPDNIPTREGHNFEGWNQPLTNIKKNLDVYAIYSINKFVVSFEVNGGDLITPKEVNWNDHLQEIIPTREGFIFEGWFNDEGLIEKFNYASGIKSDITLYAKWRSVEAVPTKYLVQFFGMDNVLINEVYIEHGQSAQAPTVPRVTGYDFVGWDHPFNNIQKDTAVHAIYDIKVYTVVFKDHDGKVLKTQQVNYNEAAEAPSDPIREGYTFVSWIQPFDKVVTNLEINPLYELNTYTIKYVSNSPEVVPSVEVKWGEYATEPTPFRDDFTLVGWYTDSMLQTKFSFSTPIKKDITLYAKWAPVEGKPVYHLVTFNDKDGKEFFRTLILENTSATKPVAPVVEGYDFIGWDNDVVNITQDTIFNAVYKIKVYEVHYLDHDGMTLKIDFVEHGSDSIAPSDPTYEGHVFKNWNVSLENITKDISVIAIYEKNKYEVHFETDGANEVESLLLEYLSVVAEPTVNKEGYKLLGWYTDANFQNKFNFATQIKSDLTLYALFEANEVQVVIHTVTFKDANNDVFLILEVPSGKSLSAPVGPSKEGHTFDGWDTSLNNITTDLTVLPLFVVKEYMVIFKDYDASIIDTVIVKHGEDAIAPAEPSREGYDFSSWSTTFVSVQSDIEVFAKYDRQSYIVQFNTNGGSIIQAQYIDFERYASEVIPSRNGYAFNGWFKNEALTEKFNFATPIIQPITLHAAWITLVQPTSSTVTFKEVDDTVLHTIDVSFGEVVNEYIPSKEGYKFVGWYLDVNFSNKFNFSTTIKSDLNLYAKWEAIVVELKDYIVSFNTVGASDVLSQVVPEGSKVISPEAPEKYGYQFDGWYANAQYTLLYDFNLPVTKDIVIFAKWKTIRHTVQFVDYDGSVIDTFMIETGRNAYEPARPQRVGYSFDRWDKDFTNVHEDLVVRATYTINRYVVTFETNGGTEVQSVTTEYNTLIEAPYDPSKLGYLFDGWYLNGQFTGDEFLFDKPITANTKLYTKWTNNTNTVTFYSESGEVIKTVLVITGEDAIAPVPPTKAGYNFIGWDTDFTNVHTNLSVTAIYAIFKYIVTFESNGGSQVEPIYVEYRARVYEPLSPTKEGYDFEGWYTDGGYHTKFIFGNTIAADTKLYAKWVPLTYNVEFIDFDDRVIVTRKVEAGTDAVAPENPTRTGYTFDKWSISFDNVTKHLIVKALYKINVYVVTFDTGDGVNNLTQSVEYNALVTVPVAPIKEGHNFIGWFTTFGGNLEFDFNETRIDKATTVFAKFEKLTYTVRFMNMDGTVIGSPQQVKYGENAVVPMDPVLYGYEFIEWIQSYKEIKADIDIHPRFNKEVFTVTFNSNGGNSVASKDAYYKDYISEPTSPEKQGYIFKGWYLDSSLETPFNFNSEITSDLTVYAKWIDFAYQVTFVDHDGTVLSLQYIPQGSPALTPDSPIREGYTFLGWNGSYINIVKDTVITASYSIKDYNVIFHPNNGTNISTQSIQFMELASSPETPIKENYVFGGWYMDDQFTIPFNFLNPIKHEVNLYAKWSVPVYTVTFYDYNNEIFKTIEVEHGQDAIEPLISRPGYIFENWNVDLTNITSNLNTYPIFIVEEYTIEYFNEEGSVISTTNRIKYTVEDIFDLHPIGKENYKFVGWRTQDGDIINTVKKGQIGHLALTAVFARPDHTIKFVNYGQVRTETLYYGETINLLDYFQLNSGLVFDGYYENEEKTKVFSKIQDLTFDVDQYTPSEIHIKYVVEITYQFDTDVTQVLKVERNTVFELLDGTSDTHTFKGWFLDPTLTIEVGPNGREAKFINPTRLYAKYVSTIVFLNTQIANESLPNIEVLRGQTFSTPQATSKNEAIHLTGYEYKDQTYRFGASITPTGDMTLTILEEDKIQIHYHLNGGTGTEYSYAVKGTIPIKPTDPYKTDGYGFGGWYYDQAFTEAYRFDSVLPEDTQLYAKWTYYVYFKDVNGTELFYGLAEHNYPVKNPGAPSKEGYKFVAWYADIALTSLYDFNLPIRNTGTVVYAKWAEVFTVSFYDQKFNFTKIFAKQYTTFAISDDGEHRVFVWGRNTGYMNGVDTAGTSINKPKDITNLIPLERGETVEHIEVGYEHTLMLTSLGRVLSVGYANSGVGFGNTSPVKSLTPIIFPGLEVNETIVKISTYTDHNFAVTSMGRLYGWGNNDYYKVTTYPTGGHQQTPVIVNNFGLLEGEKILDAKAGEDHSLILTSNGRMFAWGYGDQGNLGNGVFGTKYEAQRVITTMLQADEQAIEIIVGQYHNYFRTNKNRLFGFGRGENGALGTGGTDRVHTPTDLTAKFGTVGIENVYANDRNSIVIREDGRVYAFGYNGYGQLGDRSNTDKYSPVDVTQYLGLNSSEKVISATQNKNTSYYLTNYGRIIVTGYDGYGMLGDGGSDSNINIPKQINPQNFKLVDTLYFAAGETIEFPPEPVNPGYRIEGWYLTYNEQTGIYSDRFNGGSMPNRNMILYAKWIMEETGE